MANASRSLSFAAGITHSQKLCALGNALLATLNLVALVLSVLAYTRGATKQPEELAQCVLIGVFLPLVIFSAYLVLTLKSGRRITYRLIFVGTVITVYGLLSLGFGVVFARRLVKNESWRGEVTVRTGATVVNLISVAAAAVVLYFHRPLLYDAPNLSTL